MLSGPMKDCQKYLGIYDFLVMPCSEAKSGFYLFDIDEHDVSVWYGADIEETNYECMFKGERPVPASWEKFEDIIFPELKVDLLELYPEEDEEPGEMQDHRIIHMMYQTLADALYSYAQTQVVALKEEEQKQDPEGSFSRNGELLKRC